MVYLKQRNSPVYIPVILLIQVRTKKLKTAPIKEYNYEQLCMYSNPRGGLDKSRVVKILK